MKVLQISSAQSLGGGERHLADLVKGLTRRGHEVFVALRPNTPLIAELESVPRERIVTLALRNSLDATSARELSRLVRKNQIEIVHAHMARDYPLAAFAVRKNSARLVVTRHVLFPLNPLHRVTLSKAGRIIAVSEAVASQLVDSRVAPSEKISVVLNGIDTDRFVKACAEFDRAAFLNSWNLPNDALLVGTVGELTPLKGQEDFLLAAAQLLKQLPKLQFIIAGIDHSKSAENRARLERLIEELGLRENVRLVGWLEDLAQLYCALDVFVSASHTESFGLVLAEAMASRAAVVATETGGAREVIQPETGLLVPISDAEKLAEAILMLLNDPQKRDRMGRTGQQSAIDRFGVARMVDETERIYREEIEKA